LLRFANDLEEFGKVEQMPALEGKRMIIMMSPIAKKGATMKPSDQKDINKDEAND